MCQLYNALQLLDYIAKSYNALYNQLRTVAIIASISIVCHYDNACQKLKRVMMVTNYKVLASIIFTSCTWLQLPCMLELVLYMADQYIWKVTPTQQTYIPYTQLQLLQLLIFIYLTIIYLSLQILLFNKASYLVIFTS